MNPILMTTLGCFLLGPCVWTAFYFLSDLYTQDQLMDKRDRGEISEVQYWLLYEKASLGEYKLYPKWWKP